MDLIGATYLRDVEPGEVVVISESGLKSLRPFSPAPKAQCIFEHVYFSRPDSYVFGESVNEIRTEFGRKLARESGVEADVVVPIPDSGVCAAITLLSIRHSDADGPDSKPLRAARSSNRSSRFAISACASSLIRCEASSKDSASSWSMIQSCAARPVARSSAWFGAGAREVHMRISCPPTISPCFYGVDTPRRSELIAATHTLEEIRKHLNADSVRI